MFKIEHVFQCMACNRDYVLERSGNAGLEPPELPDGLRTLHCELDSTTNCLGKMKYRFFRVPPISDQRLVKPSILFSQRQSSANLNGTEAKAAAAALWQKLQTTEQVPANAPVPNDLWEKVQRWYETHLQEQKLARPKNPLEAMNLVLQGNPAKDRTIAVAFHTKGHNYVTGYSGVQSNDWTRTQTGVVHVPAEARLSALEVVLSDVEKKLTREVWVCAEVDAAVKALRNGWDMDSLKFTSVEFKKEKWRDIRDCDHCLQWAYS